MKGEKTTDATADSVEGVAGQPNGKKQKSIVNGTGSASTNGFSRSRVLSLDGDPNSQLELEMRQAHQSQHDDDVEMTG